jgi:hypothetical protein
MLASISSVQFTEWMSFYSAELDIKREAHETAVLEKEALDGAEAIRGKLNSGA